MKTSLLFITPFLLLSGFYGCSEVASEEQNLFSNSKIKMTIHSTGPQTRADYTDLGSIMGFSWRSGDATSVVVYGVQDNQNCQLTTTTEAKSAPFIGTVSAWEGVRNIYAFYPYSATPYVVSGGDNSSTAISTLTLPNPQNYTVGGSISNSFMVGVGSATAAGSAIDAQVSFKQVMSIVKINISHAPGKVIGVNLKCSESVFPTSAVVNLNNATISNISSFVNELKMNVTDGTVLENKSISFAMFPIDLTGKKVTIEVLFENGFGNSIEKSGIAFARNTHYNIAFDASNTPSYLITEGLKWAVGNLVADGTHGAKIGSPTDNGLYFQFGSLLGWSSIGNATLAVSPAPYLGGNSWNPSWTGDPTSDIPMYGAGDPCRYYLGECWRLPTQSNLTSLFSNSNYPTSGAWVWDLSFASPVLLHNTGLVLPTSGYRNGNDILNNQTHGYYWSSSLYYNEGYNLDFDRYTSNPASHSSTYYAMPIRCIHN